MLVHVETIALSNAKADSVSRTRKSHAPCPLRALSATPALIILLLAGLALRLAMALFLSAAFFILPTRVHERYLFPVFAFLPILAVDNRRWAVALVLFAIGSFINLHAILTIPTYATDNLKNLPFGELFRNYPFVLLSVVLQTAGFVYAAWQLRPAAADETQFQILSSGNEQDRRHFG